MKKQIAVFCALAALAVAGCSPQSRDSLDELGNDMKRDVNDAARNVDNAVKDAVD